MHRHQNNKFQAHLPDHVGCTDELVVVVVDEGLHVSVEYFDFWTINSNSCAETIKRRAY